MASDDDAAPFTEKLARIRHDLRTPVGHILGYAEMIEEEDGADLPPEALRDVRSLQTIGHRLLALIDEHLGAAKKSPDQLDLPRAHYDFRVQLSDVAGYAAMLHDQAVEEGWDDVVGDLERIIEAEHHLAELLEARVTPEALADSGVAEHDETAATPAEERASRQEVGEQWERVDHLGHGGDLLVVDDDPANRDLLTRRLAGQGYRAEAVESGERALERIAEQRPDLVLLDLVMPGMDGLEVLRRLKSDPSLRSIPVLMLSAADSANDVVRSIAHGAEDFIPKPFNPILLRARIGAVLEKHRLRERYAAQLKVFISSPGDVVPERQIVKQVITDLNEELAGRAVLIPMLWEEEPLLASDTFQAQIKPSGEADIYVGIFWSRIGSMLPATISRPDGSRYESGTAFEFEEAFASHRERGTPDIVVYRKEGAPTMSLESHDAVLEQLDQMKRLQAYLDSWFLDDDGSYSGAFHTFETSEQFESMVTTHLRKLVTARLDGAGSPLR